MNRSIRNDHITTLTISIIYANTRARGKIDSKHSFPTNERYILPNLVKSDQLVSQYLQIQIQ